MVDSPDTCGRKPNPQRKSCGFKKNSDTYGRGILKVSSHFFFLKGPPLVILEFVPHGDLLGYLRKSNGENDDFYDFKSKDVPSKIPERQLYQFSADIARGMEFISAHQVC